MTEKYCGVWSSLSLHRHPFGKGDGASSGTTGPEPRVTAWVWEQTQDNKQGDSEIRLCIWALQLPPPHLEGVNTQALRSWVLQAGQLLLAKWEGREQGEKQMRTGHPPHS